MFEVEAYAYPIMQETFATISREEMRTFDGYFAADMMKVNQRDSIYPCFIGFDRFSLTIVKMNQELNKEEVFFLPKPTILSIKIKKKFLSHNFYILLECENKTSYKVEVPAQLKYIPCQKEDVVKFKQYFSDML